MGSKTKTEGPRQRVASAMPTLASQAMHAAWEPGARGGARIAHPPRRSPSTTAATVDSSSQLLLRKRLKSHPFLAGFPIAGAQARSRRCGRRYCARGSAVRAWAGGRGETASSSVAWRRRDAGAPKRRVYADSCRCHCHCHRRHLGSRTVTATQLARWFCVAGTPGSSCCRSLQRPGQPARKEGGAAAPGGGWVRAWGARGPGGAGVGGRPVLRPELGWPLREPEYRPVAFS